MPHRIRLKKPWSRRDDCGEMTHGVDVPDVGENREVRRCAIYCRRFNLPTGIEASDRLELEIGEVNGNLAHVRLNQIAIHEHQSTRMPSPSESHPARFDITEQVSDHNELEIEIHAAGGNARLLGPVNLWILP